MLYALLSTAMTTTLLPRALSAPLDLHTRAAGDSLNFDLKIWSTDHTLSVIPTDFGEGKTDQFLPSTSNLDYTAKGTEPDYKTPEGATE